MTWIWVLFGYQYNYEFKIRITDDYNRQELNNAMHDNFFQRVFFLDFYLYKVIRFILFPCHAFNLKRGNQFVTLAYYVRSLMNDPEVLYPNFTQCTLGRW